MPERTVSILAILKDQLSPGLKNIGKNFRGLRESVGTLGRQFSFLTGTAAKFIGAFAGIQGIRRALDLAEKQVEATTQLAFALEGLPEIYAQINKEADEFQRNTTIGNEEFQRQAAILKASGVAAEDLADSTKAVFQAATALGKPVESIRAQLVAITATGTARGELKGALEGVTKEALLQGAAFKVLGERYAGAAEKLAETPFGRAKQEANELGDTLEEIGKTLIEVKVAFLEAANEGVKQLLEVFKSPTWKVFANILGEIVAFAVKLLPTVLGLVAAYKAWRIAVWAVVTAKLALVAVYKALLVVASVTSTVILAPWLLIPAAVGLALVAVSQFVDIFGNIGESAEEFGKTVSTLWGGITSGAIGVSDVVDVVKNAFLTLFLRIGTGFFDPVESAFRKLWAFVVGGWKSANATSRLLFLTMADSIGDVFFNLVTFIAEKIDRLNGLAADALTNIPIVGKTAANAVRTNLAEATKGGFTALNGQIEAAKAATVKAVTGTKAALDKIDAEMEKSAETSAKVIALLAKETEGILERARVGIAKMQEEAVGGKAIEGVSAQQLQQEVDLAAQIRAVRANENQEALDILAQQEADALERRFNLGQISEFEFAAERLRIAEETNEKEKKLIDDQIAALELLATERFESGQASADVLQKQLVLEKKQQEGAAEYAATLRALSDDVNTFAANLTTQAVAAQDEFNASLEETAFLVDDGAVTQEEAAARNVAAMKLFEDEIKRVQIELLALQTQGGDTEAFEGATAKIEELWAEVVVNLGEANEAIKGNALSTWGRISESFRQNLVQPIIDFSDTMADMFMGFETGFDDANDAFRDFGKQALKILLQILQRWLIMKALGLPTFGANAGGLVHESGMVFAGGGHVPGPAAVHRDTVPAMLTPGEFVVRESAASYYGAGIMRAINAAMFPRALFGRPPGGAARYAGGGFQAGGDVAATASPAAQAGPSEALVVASEAAFGRLLAGGQGSLMRFFEAHKTEITGILGS